MSERNRLTDDERAVWIAVYAREYVNPKKNVLDLSSGPRAKKLAWAAVEDLRRANQSLFDVPLDVLDPIPPVKEKD